MIDELVEDPRVIFATRVSRMFPVLSPFDVLDIRSKPRRALLVAALTIAVNDEKARHGVKTAGKDVVVGIEELD